MDDIHITLGLMIAILVLAAITLYMIAMRLYRLGAKIVAEYRARRRHREIEARKRVARFY